MADRERNEISQILAGLAGTQPDRAVADRLFELAYGELRRIAADLMRRERPGHTLHATALVNEAYLRLADDTKIAWQSRAHFFGIAGHAMRRILVEQARQRATAKRGGGWQQLTLVTSVALVEDRDLEILELDRFLAELTEVDERVARIVELRVFAGLTVEEVAEILGVSVRTVYNDWGTAKLWFTRCLSEGNSR